MFFVLLSRINAENDRRLFEELGYFYRNLYFRESLTQDRFHLPCCNERIIAFVATGLEAHGSAECKHCLIKEEQYWDIGLATEGVYNDINMSTLPWLASTEILFRNFSFITLRRLVKSRTHLETRIVRCRSAGNISPMINDRFHGWI